MSLSQKVSFDTTLGLFWLCIRSLLTLTRTSVWMAGLYYERHVDVTAAALGIPETEELDGAGGGVRRSRDCSRCLFVVPSRAPFARDQYRYRY